MRSARAWALGVALSALAAASVHAQILGSDEPYTGPNGLYMRAEGGRSHLNDEKGQGASGLNFASTEEEGYVAGGAVGWKFGQLRAELGLDFSGYSVATIRINGDGGLGVRLHSASLSGASADPSGSVHVIAGMVNGYWDLRTGTPFVPYIGIGVGVARTSLDNFAVGGKPLSNSSDIVFAYQPMVGVRYHVTDNFAFGLEYRYFATVQPTFKDSSGVPFRARIESHNVLASLSYFFGAPRVWSPPQTAPAVAPPPAPPPAGSATLPAPPWR